MFSIDTCLVCARPLRFCFPIRFDAEEMRVWRCDGCGCYVKSPFYDADELRKIYASYPIHEHSYTIPEGEALLLDAKIERIERLAPKRGRLLEIGCGRGHLLARAARRGWDVTGIELEGSAREHLLPEVADRVRFVRSEDDLSALDAEGFDVVCSYQLFEHLLRPAEALKQWVEALRSGGLLVTDTPNAGSLGARWHRERWINHARREHFVIFSAAALSRLYRQAGVAVLRTLFGGPPPVVSRGERIGAGARKLLRSRSITRAARSLICRFGLGDNVEMIGRKK